MLNVDSYHDMVAEWRKKSSYSVCVFAQDSLEFKWDISRFYIQSKLFRLGWSGSYLKFWTWFLWLCLFIKNVYLSFARNSKFTSINTLPMINFMQRSLVEIYATNVKLAYDHMFIYIRQLAIHLRNAMNSKKKDTYQAVYNWQFVHSLSLWSKVLGEMVSRTSNEYLIQLIYPLTQVIMGTIK